jgi:hypothetical protein
MNHHEHPDDSTVIRELRDSLAELAVPRQPPLAAITGRGRGHRRRRAGFAGVGVTGAAASIALVLGLTGAFGPFPPRSTGTIGGSAFSVTSYTDGTLRVKLGLLFDPAALQRALAYYHVPALVRNASFCSSSPAIPDSVINGVLPGAARPQPRSTAAQHRSGVPNLFVDFNGLFLSGNFPVKPSQLAPSVDPVTIVIEPAALRPGLELFIGYFNLGHTVLVGLIYTSSHSCVNRQIMPDAP